MSVLRKVDDMFVIINCDKTEALDELNSYNSKTHFTYESAVNRFFDFWTVS